MKIRALPREGTEVARKILAAVATLRGAADAVMAHQWSNSRPAMDALTRLIDAAYDVERLVEMLNKHGLMGSPLRDGTRCTRLSEDGEPCGLEPPCPDCEL